VIESHFIGRPWIFCTLVLASINIKPINSNAGWALICHETTFFREQLG